MNLMPFIYGWVVLIVAVAALAVRRQTVARHDDETLHLKDTEAALVSKQFALERKIRVIDRWGPWLTVVAVLYGLALFGTYVYHLWVAGAKLPTLK
jgi:hypothetical protein